MLWYCTISKKHGNSNARPPAGPLQIRFDRPYFQNCSQQQQLVSQCSNLQANFIEISSCIYTSCICACFVFCGQLNYTASLISLCDRTNPASKCDRTESGPRLSNKDQRFICFHVTTFQNYQGTHTPRGQFVGHLALS